jgi:hypothetical protein
MRTLHEDTGGVEVRLQLFATSAIDGDKASIEH